MERARPAETARHGLEPSEPRPARERWLAFGRATACWRARLGYCLSRLDGGGDGALEVDLRKVSAKLGGCVNVGTYIHVFGHSGRGGGDRCCVELAAFQLRFDGIRTIWFIGDAGYSDGDLPANSVRVRFESG